MVVHTGTRLADGVAVPERVPVLVGVLLRVAADVRVGEAPLVRVFVTAEDAVNDRDTVDDGDTVSLAEAELDALELPLEEPEGDAEEDDVFVSTPSSKPRPAPHSSAGGCDSTRESRGRAAAGTGGAPSLGRAAPDTAPHKRRRRTSRAHMARCGAVGEGARDVLAWTRRGNYRTYKGRTHGGNYTPQRHARRTQGTRAHGVRWLCGASLLISECGIDLRRL